MIIVIIVIIVIINMKIILEWFNKISWSVTQQIQCINRENAAG